MKKLAATLALVAVLFAGTAMAQFQPGDLVSIKLTATDVLDRPSVVEGTLVEVGITYVVYSNDDGVWLTPWSSIRTLKMVDSPDD